MTADEVKKLLGLVPHPREGGWFVRTYEAGRWLGQSVFRMEGIVGDAGLGLRFITCWRLGLLARCIGWKSDEVFHFYMGDAGWRCCGFIPEGGVSGW